MLYETVKRDGAVVGYGLIDKITGDIPQLAVDKNFRCDGIAESLMDSLIKATESPAIRIVNIDSQSRAMQSFLAKTGFTVFATQYEMIRELQ